VKWKNSNCEDTDDDYTLKSFMTGKHTNVFFML
jgi:hypothetical protein